MNHYQVYGAFDVRAFYDAKAGYGYLDFSVHSAPGNFVLPQEMIDRYYAGLEMIYDHRDGAALWLRCEARWVGIDACGDVATYHMFLPGEPVAGVIEDGQGQSWDERMEE
jgi:hypothetical protein